MKKKLLLLHLLAATFFANAQNVGIGTNTPVQKLHVEGTTFLNGNVGIGENVPAFPISFSPALGDKISLWSNSANSYGFGIQGSLLQIHTDISSADIAFGYGSSALFTERMRIKGNGNIGMGVTDPVFRADISGRLRIRTGTDGEAGIYLNNGANTNLQAFVGLENDNYVGFYGGAGAGWALGVNTSNGDVKLLNRVGIGNVNPAYQLDISNRMRIRSGGNNSVSAGLWLNNNSNSETAFIGMEDDTHVGFFGTGAGWKFGMNTQTGALKINGSVGNIGQVITSNGATSPSWISPTNFLYNNMQEFTQSSNITITGFSAIPDMTQTITTPACKVLLIVKGFMLNNECFNCGPRSCKYDIWVDGTLIERNIITVGNGVQAIVSNGGKIHGLTAGAHTIAVNVDGDGKDFYISGFRLVVLVIPQ